MAFTRDDILEHLQTEAGADTSKIDDKTLLFSSGMIDSFAMVSMIVFIERGCGIKIKPTDVNMDNLDSIERILSFVARN
jgi:acyl carrier protein